MALTVFGVLALLSTVTNAAQLHRNSAALPWAQRPNTAMLSDAAAQVYLESLEANYTKNTIHQLTLNGTSTCNASNVHVRRSWDDMNAQDRLKYIQAVQCMAQHPTQTDLEVVPGVRNRIDDYVWQHTAQTNYIHFSGLLLPWHRQFIWTWEQELQQICNYTGALPYWDWSRHAYNQTESPVLQADSFGGNGAYVQHSGYNTSLPGLRVTVFRDAGTGGGCVKDGPFANWTLHIGLVTPVNNTVYGSQNTLVPNNTFGQQYQPRCLKRDFLQIESTQFLDYSNVALLLQQDNIHTFHPMLENGGIHNGGHFFTGGDMADIYASPNDPLFFLHHAQVDRLWTIWQAQDRSRAEALDGTLTFLNIPPSANATLDSIMELGVVGAKVPIRKAMLTTGNDYCYMYV